MTDNTSIVLNNVSYAVRQGFFLQPKQIIKNLSFVIPKGVSFGLIGSNGAGKTTTIKLCTGIISPDFGEVLINGRPLNSDHDNRHAVGLLTENQYIPQYLTVTEWLSFLGTLSGLSKHELNESMSTQLSQFDLTSLADRKINSLSKGQVQRVGFAQAFLNTPQILFLDEPMSGLDPAWRAKIHSILLSFKKSGGTLLFSSHVISDVLQLSDMIAVINCGQIKLAGNYGRHNECCQPIPGDCTCTFSPCS